MRTASGTSRTHAFPGGRQSRCRRLRALDGHMCERGDPQFAIGRRDTQRDDAIAEEIGTFDRHMLAGGGVTSSMLSMTVWPETAARPRAAAVRRGRGDRRVVAIGRDVAYVVDHASPVNRSARGAFGP